jgi:hypothetical protein
VGFARVIRQWLWDSYDYLLILLLANAVWFLVTVVVVYTSVVALLRVLEQLPPEPGVLLFAAIAWIIGTLLLTGWGALFGAICIRIAGEQPAPFREIGALAIRLLPRMIRFFSIALATIVAMLVAVWFYALSGNLAGEWRWIGLLLGGMTFWALLAFLAVSLVGWGYLLRTGHSTRQALRVGMLTLLRRPGLVIGALVHLGILWFFSLWLKMVGAFLFSFALSATFLNSLHDVLEAELHPEEELPPPEKAATWRERELLEKAHEQRRMNQFRYRRTLRDVLRPWEQ